MLNVIELANGTFCWLISDDDTLENDKYILNDIEKDLNK